MIKRILAGVCGPTNTASVADYVVDIARAKQAEVTAMAVTDMAQLRAVHPQPTGGKSLVQDIVNEKVELNDNAIGLSTKLLEDKLTLAGIPHHATRCEGDPIECLTGASRYHDLLITGLTGLLDHDVAAEPRDALVRLVEAGVHPILAVCASPQPVYRVLVAYSGSPESARTMRQFATYNLWPDAHVKVVHFGTPTDNARLLLAEARSYLERFGFSIETELVDGSPVRQLQAVAHDWGANVLVLGNSAKSMIRRKMLGDTAIAALRDAKLPVFLSQ